MMCGPLLIANERRTDDGERKFRGHDSSTSHQSNGTARTLGLAAIADGSSVRGFVIIAAGWRGDTRISAALANSPADGRFREGHVTRRPRFTARWCTSTLRIVVAELVRVRDFPKSRDFGHPKPSFGGLL